MFWVRVTPALQLPNLARNVAQPQFKKRGTPDSKGNATRKYRFHFKSFTNFLQGTDSKDLQGHMDNLVSLAQSDKLYIKSITEAELKDINTAAEYMLDKDDYKAAEERLYESFHWFYKY
jgi:hypothetical protein